MLKDLKPNVKLNEPMVLITNKSGTAKNGSLYATGYVLTEEKHVRIPFITFEEECVKKLQETQKPKAWMVKGKSNLTVYPNLNTLQITISQLDEVPAGTNITKLLPKGSFDYIGYKVKLHNLINEVKDPDLNSLLQKIFSNGTLIRFTKNPGSMLSHHVYIGGLLEHTIDTATTAKAIAASYDESKNINKDLVITGALLHDIGKLFELSTDVGFPYTTEGRLLGHMGIGLLIIQKTAIVLNIPSRKLLELEHILMSHHGEPEKGATIPCMTKEAIIVHTADELSCKLNLFENPQTDEEFEYNPYLKHYLYTNPNSTDKK